MLPVGLDGPGGFELPLVVCRPTSTETPAAAVYFMHGGGEPAGLRRALSQVAEADELLTNDPLALLIGMVLDQRVSERTSGTGQAMPPRA